MNDSVIIWDIQTIPDLRGFAAANYLVGKTDAEIREVMGDKFPKHIYHSIVSPTCHPRGVRPVHQYERSEKDLVQAFVDKIAELNPQLVTFNGNTFDLPVLRYRAMAHGVAAPGLSARPYFNRYTDDAIDLCDVLSSFASQAKATTLHEICKVMGMSGKPVGMHGGEVARYCLEGRIKEVAEYCKTDIVNTYRVWLRYELFRGRLTHAGYVASESNLIECIRLRSNTKPGKGRRKFEK
jgi:predicted PolB exonuclease-like 3'-5' exonuclease